MLYNAVKAGTVIRQGLTARGAADRGLWARSGPLLHFEPTRRWEPAGPRVVKHDAEEAAANLDDIEDHDVPLADDDLVASPEGPPKEVARQSGPGWIGLRGIPVE